MKWIGQHIWDFISRFRSDVYLEAVESGTIASGGNLGLDSNNKIVKEADTGITDLHGAGVNGSANQLLTDDGDGTVTSEANITYDSDVLTLTSSTTLKPQLIITNTNTDDTPGKLLFYKNATGADNDKIGDITFYSKDDAGVVQYYAQIVGSIADATNGQEAGKLELKVCEYDGSGGVANTTTGLTLDGDTNADGEVDVTIGAGAASTTTVAGNLTAGGTILSGWNGSTTRIKILHSDFIPDDGGRAYMIDDTGVGSENLFGESYSNHTSYVTVAIPTGYTATHVMIYGSAAGAVEVWEHQINSKTGVSKGTGNVDTEIDITDVASSTTNYLFIQVAQGSGDEIHGGYVTIAAS